MRNMTNNFKDRQFQKKYAKNTYYKIFAMMIIYSSLSFCFTPRNFQPTHLSLIVTYAISSH